MATFKICVFKHQKRADGKYPVSIRVYWKGKSSYIGTEYYVTEKQISKKDFTLKDFYIINELNRRIAKFEEVKSKKLGFRIERYTSKEVADYLLSELSTGGGEINFVEFSRAHIGKLESTGKKSTAGGLRRTLNAMIDFCGGREKVNITEITSKFLTQFEAFLRTERTIVRPNQFGRMVTTKRPPLSDVSVFDYMTDVRLLFNAALNEYNDEDKEELRITHYPFKKYKIKPRPENKKRDLSREQIIAIRDIPDSALGLGRAIMARDVFMLSLYLVGTNLVDLYELSTVENGRVLYERSKTRGRRQDRARISIKVEPEALPLLEKYMDKSGNKTFMFHTKYSTSHGFSSNMDKGLKKVAEACGLDVPLSTYYARHSWATIAHNNCGISKDDVDLALNHVDQGHKVTDMYIKRDWSKIDTANRAVLDYLK